MSRKIFALLVAVTLTSYLVGRFSRPAKVTVTKQVDTTKDQIINELQRQLAFTSRDKISVTTTVDRPDGTHITRIRLENKNITVDSVIKESNETNHETRREQTTTVTENTRGVVVGPMVNFTTTDLSHPLYGGSVDAPFFGPVHVMGNILVGPSVGVSLGIGGGWEF